MYEELIAALRETAEAEQTEYDVDSYRTGEAASALESLVAQLAALQTENAEKGKEIERVEAERDAAIADVPHDCEHCKCAEVNGACKLLPDGDEFSPDYTDGFDRDGNCDHWEWRGAQGEG